jgi:signal transduction histidine kinase
VKEAEGRDRSTFEAETARRIADRIPIAGAAFALVIGLAWPFEHSVFPERDRTYAIVYALELAVILSGIWLTRRPRLAPYIRLITSTTALLLVVLVTTYHVVVRSTGDVLALVLLYILVGTMVSVPWGWRGQSPVAVAAVAAFVFAIASGAQPLVPVSMHILGLTTMAALSVLGAAFLDRQRWVMFQQAAELQRSNAALAEANRALERANAVKNEFLANVSHELRTPLNIIMGYVDLLAEGTFGDLSPEAKDIVERVSRTSRSLVFLVSDLLDLSRIEAGKLTVQPTRVELQPLFDEMRLYVEPRVAAKPVEFIVSPADNLAVVADRNRLEQILFNLLSNAVKFTHQGTIRLYATPSSNSHVEVHVEDTGEGIAEDELPFLFQPFHQSKAGKEAGGVGIGLALSARLATAMGGEILVASEASKGSRFTVRLPRVQP